MEEKNLSKIYNLSLAIESYVDNTGNNIDTFNEINLLIRKLRSKKDIMTNDQINNLTNDILKKIDIFLDMVGREKFVFYEDGVVEYKWDYDLIKEEKE